MLLPADWLESWELLWRLDRTCTLTYRKPTTPPFKFKCPPCELLHATDAGHLLYSHTHVEMRPRCARAHILRGLKRFFWGVAASRAARRQSKDEACRRIIPSRFLRDKHRFTYEAYCFSCSQLLQINFLQVFRRHKLVQDILLAVQT